MLFCQSILTIGDNCQLDHYFFRKNHFIIAKALHFIQYLLCQKKIMLTLLEFNSNNQTLV